jgi:hypothetical protein
MQISKTVAKDMVYLEKYDPASGLYFKSIEENIEDKKFMKTDSNNIVSNIGIYDPDHDRSTMLFKDSEKRNISFIIFEIGFNKYKKLIKFYESDYSCNEYIKNNHNIKEQSIKDKLLVGIKDKNKEVTMLWVSSKNGDNLNLLASVSFDDIWHIDVKNSKIRVVSYRNASFKIDSYEW